MGYSQRGEDEIISRILGDKPGMLLDIGAWDPKIFSNSRALIERGWGAVLVEPSPAPMRNLIAEYGNHPRVTLVSAAVITTPEKLLRMYITDDGVSTSDEATKQTWTELGGYLGSIWVPTITVPDICNQFGGFGFVNIDAEGTSVEIARAVFTSQMRPQCICVEHDNRTVELSLEAQRSGYRVAYVNEGNVILEAA